MRILILGGDGYLGWAQSLYLSNQGHDITIIDNLERRKIDIELSLNSLIPIWSIGDRVNSWYDLTGESIEYYVCDITDYSRFSSIVDYVKPQVIIHFAEQRSAPYSMISQDKAAYTMQNNVIGTLNVLYAMKEFVPDCHLIKLGTMGEYGTPNIDIEEGFIKIEHNGRNDILPYPKQAGSFYHLTKVHDSNNIMFCCKIWGLRVTDLNQGVVYGVETNETTLDNKLLTRFDYDHIYGTVLNRFCCQAAVGYPLSVYGSGGQTRGYINIQDTLKCIELAINYPPEFGEYRVFNQITEQFSVLELANKVKQVASDMDIKTEIEHIPNPRIESEDHYYNAKYTKLSDLGLEPCLLNDNMIASLILTAIEHMDRIDKNLFHPTIGWS